LLDTTTDYGYAWTAIARSSATQFFAIDYRLRLRIEGAAHHRLQITAVVRGGRKPIDYKLRLLSIDYRFMRRRAKWTGGDLRGPWLLGSRD